MSTENPEALAFSYLNLEKVKSVAQTLIDSFPKLHFTQVKILKNSPKLAACLDDYKKYYVLVFEVIDVDCFTQQYEELKESLRHPFKKKLSSIIGNSLGETYRQAPRPDYPFWDEWDFHLTTVNRRDVINDQFTPTDSFLDQAESFDFVILIENKELMDSNDGIRLDGVLLEIEDKISTISHSLEKNDSLEDIDKLKLLKLEYENKLHDLLVDSINLNKASSKDLSGEPAQAEFIDKGEVFQISFSEREIQIKKLKGARSLHYLIERKGEYVPKIDLDIHLNPAPPSDQEYSETSGQKYSDLEINEDSTRHRRNPTESISVRLKKLYSQIKDVDEQIAEAKRNNDQREIERLIGIKSQLQKAIDDILNRDLPVYVKNIGKVINRTIKNIGEHHKELGKHLSDSIKNLYGKETGYLPNPDITWRTK